MSENPAHAQRRALSPPAVTRFQLITPTASEAVFAPPYVPARSERLRYTRKPPQPVTYTQFPEPVVRQPAPPPMPPPLAPVEREPEHEPEREPEPAREAPGTWREVIARVDAEEPLPAETEKPPAEPVVSAAAREPEAEPQPEITPAPAVPWELEAFTTGEYTAPRVEDAVDEIAELLLDDVVGTDIDVGEPVLEKVVAGGRDEFPLDAFIVPAGTTPPRGYDSDIAHRVALGLDELAEQLRSDGLAALGGTTSIGDLSRVLAAIVTGYMAREP